MQKQIIVDLRTASYKIGAANGAAVFDSRRTRTGRKRKGGRLEIIVPEQTAALLRDAPIGLIGLPVIGPQGQRFRLRHLSQAGRYSSLVVREHIDGVDAAFPNTGEQKLPAAGAAK